MKTTQEKYNEFLAGSITREKLLYELRRDSNLTQFMSNLMSFDDSIKALKNRGILTETKKKVTTLTLDTANPYEVKKGLDYELGLCYTASPAIPIPMDEVLKAQTKVLKNLAKDPNYYTKQLAGVKPDGDLAVDADFGGKTKRSDVSVPVKKNNFKETRKGNISKTVSKDVKTNVKDTLGTKERAKNKKGKKGVNHMTMNPKKAKGVQIMKIPGKAKKVKLREAIELAQNLLDKKKISSIRESELRDQIKGLFQKDRPTGLNVNVALENIEENIPASTSDVVPFANLKPGMTVSDDSGKNYNILALGNYTDLKRYDPNGIFNKFLSSDPTGIDATQLVAVKDPEGTTSVRVYGTGGVYAYSQQEGIEDEGRGFEDGMEAGYDDSRNVSNGSTENVSEDENPYDRQVKDAEKNYYNAKLKYDQDKLSKLKEWETEEEDNEEEGPTMGEAHEIALIKHDDAVKQFMKRNNIHPIFGEPDTKISEDGSVIHTEIPGWGGFQTIHDESGNITKELKQPQPEMNENKNKNMKTKFDVVLDRILNENIPIKNIPTDEVDKAEAKAAILTTLAKAQLQGNVNLDKDLALRDGHIWVNVVLGDGILNKDQMKALSGDSNFVGVNPVDTDTITLVFKKA